MQQTVFGFTGEPTDANGLVQLRARYYNPNLGMFTGLDPLEGGMAQPMSLNRYMYVQGNVIDAVDPSGMALERPEPVANSGCSDVAPGCERQCSGLGILYGACLRLCDMEAKFMGVVPRWIDGYLEGDTGLTVTVATATQNSPGKIGPFSLYGYELVYDFVNFQRMLFRTQIIADSAVVAALSGSVYVGAILGFTPSGASPEDFGHFGQQYGGPFNFVSGGAGLGTNIPIPKTGLSGTTGVIGFWSPDYSVAGIAAYFSISASFAGPSLGPISFDASKGRTYYTPRYDTGKAYLKDCQVDIAELTSDIKRGMDGIPAIYDAIAHWREYAAEVALWSALAYNLNHLPCHGGMG